MHIPDNYLSPSTCAVLGAAMIPIWKRAAGRVNRNITKRRMPLMGIGAALSFLIMMFNIPLPGGTSGHAVGGTLVALLIGPEAACISITIALLLQALIFGDGGILSFGANAFNIAFLVPFSGYYIFNRLKNRIKFNVKSDLIWAFISSYIAINLSALFAAIEFGIQPLLFRDGYGLPMYCPYPLSMSIPGMIIPHLLVAGVLEGILTSGVYGFIKRVSPGIIHEELDIRLKPVYGLIFGMILLSPIGLLAVGTAWGEWGNEEIKRVVINGKSLGFVPKGMQKGFNIHSLMPDYAFNGLPSSAGYILSGVIAFSLLIIGFKLLTDSKFKDDIF